MMLVVAPAAPAGKTLVYWSGMSTVFIMAWFTCFVLWFATHDIAGGEYANSVPFKRWYGPMASWLFATSVVSWFITASMGVCMHIHYRGRIPYE